ncbi:MAG: hypothetical protein H6553_10770 [Chitinophagales bacterium]|nr:hypothetical protein [Chitinophagales bacterium]
MTSKLIKNILIIVTVIVLISVIISSLLPFYWGDKTQHVKVDYYKQNSEQFNTLFFGGSLEYRHISPHIIDKIANDNHLDIKSFNFGIDGHNIIQELRDIQGILKIKNDSLKQIFISVSSEPYFFAFNRHTAKWISWQNFSSYINAMRVIPTLKEDSYKTRAKYSYYYTSSLIENKLNMGIMPDALENLIFNTSLDTNYLGKYKDGFLSYDEEENLLLEYNWEVDLVKESRNAFINDKTHRDSLNQTVLASFNNYEPTDKPNKQMVKLLQNLIKQCSKKGIDVYFVLPPKARTSYSLLLPVFNALPKNRCISLADIRQYPEFYSFEYGYNFHHLNNKGAQLYSKILAQKIVQLFQQNQQAVR